MLIDLARKGIRELTAYSPPKATEEILANYGLKEVIRLSANENPWGSSPLAAEAAAASLKEVACYPDGPCTRLRCRLAETLALTPAHLTVSNGASNILVMIAEAFLDRGDEAVMAHPSFPVYRKSAQVAGARPVMVPLKNHAHDLEAMLAAVTSKTKLVFICNPNNPTGTIVERNQTEAFLKALPKTVVVVFDEVYAEFSPSDKLPDTCAYIRQRQPVISVRSFSKLYGLAGLRVGYAVAAPELIDLLDRVREAYPVNRPAQEAAIAALADKGFRDMVIDNTRQELAKLSENFQRLGIEHTASHANFIFADLGINSRQACHALLSQGILVHPVTAEGYETWCRITVGTALQNRKLVNAIKRLRED